MSHFVHFSMSTNDNMTILNEDNKLIIKGKGILSNKTFTIYTDWL